MITSSCPLLCTVHLVVFIKTEKRNYVRIANEKDILGFYIIAKPRIDLSLFTKLNFFLTVAAINQAPTNLHHHLRLHRLQLRPQNFLR
jgi:hypothetical protein